MAGAGRAAVETCHAQGEQAIPDRWTAVLHVPLPGFGDRVLHADDLRGLARQLCSASVGGDRRQPTTAPRPASRRPSA